MEVSKQEFHLKDLPTKSVTLFPSRAHVVRTLDSVQLQPGQNEIEIYGLTPTVDENSIQVYGTGAATITDFTVELVPNRDIFDEAYPQDEQDDESDDESDRPEVQDCDQVKALTAELQSLEREIAQHKEVIESATQQLHTLDAYSNSLTAQHNSADAVKDTMTMYARERAACFERHREAVDKLREAQELVTRKTKERFKAGAGDRKRFEEQVRAEAKLDLQKSLQKDKKRAEAERIKEENLKFWPKKVYVVTVNLETPLYTPASSRRGSFDSITLAGTEAANAKADPKAGGDSPQSENTISLALAYVTRDAAWTPRYDISINSIKKTASITYRAELVNGTSEVWKDTQVVLSTSQTSYAGLEDKVPTLHPWHVRLNRHVDQALLSPEEQNAPRHGHATGPAAQNRSELFGSSDASFLWGSRQQQHKQKVLQQIQQHKKESKAPTANFAAFGSSSVAGFDSMKSMKFSSRARREAPAGEAAMAAAPASSGGRFLRVSSDSGDEERDDDMGFGLFDNDAPEGERQLNYQQSQWDDHGLTSTYEIPGTRTLMPSSLARRHKIASLNATNIQVSHILVAKLRPAAFLRAKIRNPSNTVTLLKGSAGITLDGSFIGNMTLQRVGPGSTFDMSLGVDPAVQISYPKPTVQRSTTGFLSKESAQVFSRNIWITNSKIVPIELLVLDQVPVSQDERLNINIVHPRGLGREGDTARAGVAAKDGPSGSQEATKSNAWGNATATLKQGGQISWTVNLEKKQACLLKLEYETKMPAAEKIMAA